MESAGLATFALPMGGRSAMKQASEEGPHHTMIRRRMVAVCLLAVVGAVFIAVPVGAQTGGSSTTVAPGTPERYSASASGNAFKLTLLGTSLSIGSANVAIDSTPKAHADGIGALLGSTKIGGSTGDSTGGATVDNGTAASPKCGPLSLPSNIPLLGLLTACSFSHASTAGGLPSATSHGGSVDTLSLGTGSLLGTGSPLAPLGTLVNTLIGQLGTILQPIPQVTELTGLLQSLLTGNTAQLLNVAVGTNTSTASATSDAITSSSTSEGVHVCLLAPVPGVCLITVVVGTAQAQAVCARNNHVSTPTVNPAIVTVQLLPALFSSLGSLGLNPVLSTLFPTVGGVPTLQLQLGQTLDLSPLAKITASSGATTQTATGASATASSLQVDVLPSGTSGAVSLALSQAAAGVSCTPAGALIPVATTTTVKRLPFTGDNPWRPVVGVALLGLALVGFEVTRRTRRKGRPQG